MSRCPSCGRPVAVARASCLYCGRPLADETRLATAPETVGPAMPAPAAAPEPPGTLLVLDLASVDEASLARAASLSAYEARLLVRRGALHVHRVLGVTEAEAEAERLRREGLVVFLVPEGEARIQPLRALGGECSPEAATLRTEEGPLLVHREDLLLVVRGPIAREYRPSPKRRRVETATLEEGYRVHLHRRSDPRPVEIDASNFEFGFAPTGSSRLELDSWVDTLAVGLARDDEFRRLPPVLAPAEPEARSALAAAGRLGRRPRDEEGEDEAAVLDNARQFRYYSGWRAAIERRRTETG